MYGVNNIAPHDANDDLLRGASDKKRALQTGGSFCPSMPGPHMVNMPS